MQLSSLGHVNCHAITTLARSGEVNSTRQMYSFLVRTMDHGQYTIVGGLGLGSIDVAHSIINNSPKPAYLKGLAVMIRAFTVCFTVIRAQLCWRALWSNLQGEDASDNMVDQREGYRERGAFAWLAHLRHPRCFAITRPPAPSRAFRLPADLCCPWRAEAAPRTAYTLGPSCSYL